MNIGKRDRQEKEIGMCRTYVRNYLIAAKCKEYHYDNSYLVVIVAGFCNPGQLLHTQRCG